MFSSGKKVSRVIRIIIDILNVLLGIAAVVFAVLTFMNTQDNAWMFPIIFIIGGAMNFFTGIKHLMSDRKVNGIILEVAAVVVWIIAYLSYVAVGGF